MLADYENELVEFEKRYMADDWRSETQAVDTIVSNYGKQAFGLSANVTMENFLP